MVTPRPREEENVPADEPRAQAPALKHGGVRNFFHEVALEMRKVSWPTRAEVVNTTMVVVVAVFFFAFFLFGTDVALSYLIQMLEAGAQRLFG